MDLLNKGIKYSVPPLNEESAKAGLIADLEIRAGMGEKSSHQCTNYIITCESEWSVKNSLASAQNIHNIQPPPHSCFVSFDIEGLFPHIPLHVTMAYLKKLLSGAGLPEPSLNEFTELLDLCSRKFNHCKFKEKIYVFPAGIGVPIGSPLRSMIAEVFMRKFESDLFTSLITSLVI